MRMKGHPCIYLLVALLVMMMTSPLSLQKVNLVNPLKKKRILYHLENKKFPVFEKKRSYSEYSTSLLIDLLSGRKPPPALSTCTMYIIIDVFEIIIVSLMEGQHDMYNYYQSMFEIINMYNVYYH